MHDLQLKLISMEPSELLRLTLGTQPCLVYMSLCGAAFIDGGSNADKGHRDGHGMKAGQESAARLVNGVL